MTKYYIVKCNKCGESLVIEAHKSTFGGFKTNLNYLGWALGKEKDFCPKCKQKRRNDPKSNSQPKYKLTKKDKEVIRNLDNLFIIATKEINELKIEVKELERGLNEHDFEFMSYHQEEHDSGT